MNISTSIIGFILTMLLKTWTRVHVCIKKKADHYNHTLIKKQKIYARDIKYPISMLLFYHLCAVGELAVFAIIEFLTIIMNSVSFEIQTNKSNS